VPTFSNGLLQEIYTINPADSLHTSYNPKTNPDDIASLTWVCKSFEVSLHPTHPARSSPDELTTSGGATSLAAGGWIVLASDRWKTPALNELEAAFYAANQRI